MTDYSPEGVAQWMDSLGRTAFEAYRDNVQGVTYNGRPIPPWDEIAPETREAWTWSAMATIAHHVRAVASDVSRETSPEGDTDG